ncbi:hypothetical protein [Micromonospora coerulea]|uniref:hypothetical protein n=1 Tax=Micromonospora coerulea TaxID=47856 RepID=UPI001906861F|nr:hypothetical protein [Micromonospora veneta]
MAAGEGHPERASGTAHLLAHLRRATALLPELVGDTEIRVALSSRAEADALSRAVCDWAPGAVDGWTVTITGSAWPAPGRARLHRVGGRFAAEWVAWSVAVAAGFEAGPTVSIDEWDGPYAG